MLPTPDPLNPVIVPPASQTVPPPGFALNARQAVRAAQRVEAVRHAKRDHPDLRGTAYVSPLPLPQGSFYHWDVVFKSRGEPVLDVQLSPYGVVLQTTHAPDIGWSLLLGFPGVLGKKLNAPYVWLPLCALFLLPFFDPRRPFRALHFDLLVLLLFGVSHFFFNLGRPDVAVPLFYPFLVYVAIRGGLAAFRPRRRTGPLIPAATTRFLVAGVLVLMVLRIAFVVWGSSTFDISTAGVIGADRIEHGLPLYVDNSAHGDTYGPVNYLLYVPAELVFPYRETGRSVTAAAKTTTIALDIAVVLALLVLGRRIRPGPQGKRLGAALAWAWAAFPYSALILAANTNDAVVPLFILLGLVLLESAPGRGAVSAVGSMAKFVPLLLAPLFATGRGPFRWRPALVVTGFYVAIVCGLVIAFLPEHGLREFWNTTLGFQFHRQTPLAIWTRWPSTDWAKPVFTAAAVVMAVAAAFAPRRRTIGQLAGWIVAILATIQISGGYWIYFYIVWFAPFLIVALLEEYRDLGPLAEGTGQASVTSAFVKPEMISQPSSVTATRSSMRTPSLPGR